MQKIRSVKNILISMIILIILWQLLFSFSSYNENLFPSPLMAFKALVETAKKGVLFVNIFTSLYRFFLGYVIAIVFAVILGLILGQLPSVFQYINPIVQLIRPISPTAWMPFIVLLFGIGDVPAIVIIFIAAFFPVLLTTVSAVSSIEPVYLKVARNFAIEQPFLTWKVILPAAFPQIANGIHLALGSAWIFLVAGEMVGAQSGLGYQIIDARNNLRADVLLATILVIGVIGIILDSGLKTIENKILSSWGGKV